MMELVHENIEKAIIRSQHCQRNWDLSREIPQEDLDLIITAATQCPSKQNISHYKVHAITSRAIIEAIHDKTDGFTINYKPYETTTNTQVLANLLIVLEEVQVNHNDPDSIERNDQLQNLNKGVWDENTLNTMRRDLHMAVGVAAGYLNMTSSLLGYATGCCACFDGGAIKEILGLNKEPVLLMGIGFKDPNLNRRVHHKDHTFMFPTKPKQEIEVKFWA
jgi:nitroreductase